MQRYIAHALARESGETFLKTGKPKTRKETPRPRRTASAAPRNMKKGICAALGSEPTSAGGKRTGPTMKAGTATNRVTISTFIQSFICELLSYSASEPPLIFGSGTPPAEVAFGHGNLVRAEPPALLAIRSLLGRR